MRSRALSSGGFLLRIPKRYSGSLLWLAAIMICCSCSRIGFSVATHDQGGTDRPPAAERPSRSETPPLDTIREKGGSKPDTARLDGVPGLDAAGLDQGTRVDTVTGLDRSTQADTVTAVDVIPSDKVPSDGGGIATAIVTVHADPAVTCGTTAATDCKGDLAIRVGTSSTVIQTAAVPGADLTPPQMVQKTFPGLPVGVVLLFSAALFEQGIPSGPDPQPSSGDLTIEDKEITFLSAGSHAVDLPLARCDMGAQESRLRPPFIVLVALTSLLAHAANRRSRRSRGR